MKSISTQPRTAVGETWQEKLRPGHTVQIEKHHISTHWPYPQLVQYKHTGVHNLRAQSYSTVSEESKFLKRFRNITVKTDHWVIPQEQVQRIGLAALKTLNASTHTGGDMKIKENIAALERGEYLEVHTAHLAELKNYDPTLIITVHGRTGQRYKVSGSRIEK